MFLELVYRQIHPVYSKTETHNFYTDSLYTREAQWQFIFVEKNGNGKWKKKKSGNEHREFFRILNPDIILKGIKWVLNVLKTQKQMQHQLIFWHLGKKPSRSTTRERTHPSTMPRTGLSTKWTRPAVTGAQCWKKDPGAFTNGPSHPWTQTGHTFSYL